MIHPGMAAALRVRHDRRLDCWDSASLLVWLEKRPPQRQAAESVKIAWDSPFDRVGALFGPRMGPLVGHWLRFYRRNTRTRIMYLISLPLLGFLTFQIGQRMGPYSLFVAALGHLSDGDVPGHLAHHGQSVRLRRRRVPPLLPAAHRTRRHAARRQLRRRHHRRLRPAGGAARVDRLRALSASMRACWSCWPAARSPACSCFNALGIWVTLFNPRKGNYHSSFGNDLSLGGNIVLIGGMMLAIFLPRVLYGSSRRSYRPESWWMILPLPVLAVAFYLDHSEAAGPIFMTRREQLLAVVEGRD